MCSKETSYTVSTHVQINQKIPQEEELESETGINTSQESAEFAEDTMTVDNGDSTVPTAAEYQAETVNKDDSDVQEENWLSDNLGMSDIFPFDDTMFIHRET